MQPNGNIPGTTGRPVAGAPVSNVNAKPAPVPTPPPAPKPAEPAFGNGESVVEGKGGKKTGWILAVLLLLIVAAGGIGFGVWSYMDGNTQKDALNTQISSLKQQNNSLQEQLDNGDTIINIDTDVDTWDGFSNNFFNSLDGKITNTPGSYWHYTGSTNVMHYVVATVDQNKHLTITDRGGEDDSDGSVIVELDNVLATYFVEIGNGGNPCFYIIMAEDGSVRRIDISEYSDRNIEKLGDYTNIVSVIKSGLEAVLVDIDGNIYRTY